MKNLVCARLSIAIGLLATGIAAAEESRPPLTIGAVLCLSGECAEWGTNSLRGLELAASEINSRGGILGRSVEISVEDSAETSPANAVSAYKKLRSDPEISFLVGPTWTPAGLALAPIAKREKVIMLSPSLGVKDFNETSDKLFNVWPHDEFSSKRLAQHAIEQRWRRAAILSSQQPWSKTQGDVFEQEIIRLGGTSVVKLEPLETERDLRTEIAKILAADPDVVFFSVFTNQLGVAAKGLRSSGYTGPILSVLMDDTSVEAAGNASEGILFARYPASSPEFVDSYIQLFHERPGIAADTAYDALGLLERGITEAGNFDVAAVSAVLNQIQDFQGASGAINFDGKGGVIREPNVYEVRSREFRPVKSVASIN